MDLASVSTGQIVGQVVTMRAIRWMGWWFGPGLDERLCGVRQLGQFSLRQLPPGAYLVRAHRRGLSHGPRHHRRSPPCRSETPSSFTLRREGEPSVPRVTEAGVGTTAIGAAARARRPRGRAERNRPGLAPAAAEAQHPARQRHRRRPAARRRLLVHGSVRISGPRRGDFCAGRPARCSRDISLDGQVDLLTTGAFDSPASCSRWTAPAALRSSRSAPTSAIMATGLCGPR